VGLYTARARLRIACVRLAASFLAALALVTCVACAGDDDAETGGPATLTLSQRLVSAEDAPDSKADPVEQGGTTVDFDEFIQTLSEMAVDPDPDEMTGVFEEAGFRAAGTETRFYGETHSRDAPHLTGSVIELESEDGATSALDWLETDRRKPCPMSCAVDRSGFDVDDIPGARGIHLSATAEDIERVGTEDERPFDGYWIGFTDGSFVYTVDLHGPPGSVSEDQAQEIATAYYERIAGT
jgi:hypothetical protein